MATETKDPRATPRQETDAERTAREAREARDRAAQGKGGKLVTRMTMKVKSGTKVQGGRRLDNDEYLEPGSTVTVELVGGKDVARKLLRSGVITTAEVWQAEQEAERARTRSAQLEAELRHTQGTETDQQRVAREAREREEDQIRRENELLGI